jgi:hypothetical protein
MAACAFSFSIAADESRSNVIFQPDAAWLRASRAQTSTAESPEPPPPKR